MAYSSDSAANDTLVQRLRNIPYSQRPLVEAFFASLEELRAFNERPTAVRAVLAKTKRTSQQFKRGGG